MEEQEIYDKKYKNLFEVFVTEIIEKNGIKISHVAKGLGISHPTYRRMMEDPGEFDVKKILLLSHILLTTPFEVFNKIIEHETQTQLASKKLSTKKSTQK